MIKLTPNFNEKTGVLSTSFEPLQHSCSYDMFNQQRLSFFSWENVTIANIQPIIMNNTKMNISKIVKILPGPSPNARVTSNAKPIIPPNISNEKKIVFARLILYLPSLNP